jgi:hypothetical protein
LSAILKVKKTLHSDDESFEHLPLNSKLKFYVKLKVRKKSLKIFFHKLFPVSLGRCLGHNLASEVIAFRILKKFFSMFRHLVIKRKEKKQERFEQ